MIKIKENIFNSIRRMNTGELAFLYEQIRFIEKRKSVSPQKQKRKTFSIEQILQMTSSSQSNWSDTVIEEREERI